MPEPQEFDRPLEYCDRVTNWYRKAFSERPLGQVFTPRKLAIHLARMVPGSLKLRNILDPGTGIGVLSCAVVERFVATPKSDPLIIHAVELDPNAATVASKVLEYASEWAKRKGPSITIDVIQQDFIDYALERLGHDTINTPINDGYDLVITNPPYFKMRSSNPMIEKSKKIVGRNSNAYTLFLSLSVELLRKRGYVISINPRSFLSGKSFEKFRKKFFHNILPTKIHHFESRKSVFQDADVQQEIIVIAGVRKRRKGKTILITSSFSLNDLNTCRSLRAKVSAVLSEGIDKQLALPLSSDDLTVLKLVRTWDSNLEKSGIEISTGPIVPFRFQELIDEQNCESNNVVPLLWMQNVQPLEINWPLENGKPQKIHANGGEKPIVPNGRFILLRRVIVKSDNARLIAAVIPDRLMEYDYIGIENHVNVVHRNWKDLPKEYATGLSLLLNSGLISRYFQIMNGTTQVNAYDVRLLPLPDYQLLKEMGEIALECPEKWDSLPLLDNFVESWLVK